MSFSDQDAENALRFQIQAMKELGTSQAAIDAATARNVLHEDLGYFRSKTQTYYLDDETRDKLIVHTRQDAAHAIYAASTATKEVQKLRRTVLALVAVVLMLAVSNVAVIFGAR